MSLHSPPNRWRFFRGSSGCCAFFPLYVVLPWKLQELQVSLWRDCWPQQGLFLPVHHGDTQAACKAEPSPSRQTAASINTHTHPAATLSGLHGVAPLGVPRVSPATLQGGPVSVAGGGGRTGVERKRAHGQNTPTRFQANLDQGPSRLEPAGRPHPSRKPQAGPGSSSFPSSVAPQRSAAAEPGGSTEPPRQTVFSASSYTRMPVTLLHSHLSQRPLSPFPQLSPLATTIKRGSP